MRNARGKFTQGGQAFFDLYLALQRRQFGKIAEQAQRTGNLRGLAQNRRDGHSKLAQFAFRSCVLDLLAPKGAALAQARGQEI